MNNNKVRYSVLTYIIGTYEIVHEIKEKDPEAEYVLVTDNPNLTSETWEIKLVENQHPEDPFDLCYKIRFNPFDYVTNDIVVRIDGSMEVGSSLQPIVAKFAKENYDRALLFHPTRVTLYDEYVAWVQQRQYPVEQANTVLNFLAQYEGYDVKNYKGLIQMNFEILRKNKINLALNHMTLSFLKYLAEPSKQIERLDQTIFSFVLQKYFPNLNIMFWDERLCHSKFFTWYAHGSNNPFAFGGVKDLCKPFAFNKPYHNQNRPDDY